MSAPNLKAVAGLSRISGDRFYLRRTGANDPLLSFALISKQPKATLQRPFRQCRINSHPRCLTASTNAENAGEAWRLFG